MESDEEDERDDGAFDLELCRHYEEFEKPLERWRWQFQGEAAWQKDLAFCREIASWLVSQTSDKENNRGSD
jgi:hypothetical protein